MEDSLASRLVAKIAIAIFIIAALDLVFINWWILKKSTILSEWQNLNIKDKKSEVEQKIEPTNPSLSPSPTPEIALSSPTPASSGSSSTSTPQTIVEKQTQTVIQTANREIFIPMGSGQSKSGTFENVAGTEIAIDTTKYSSIDYIVFEASVWVDGGNGRAWAQIKNVTDSNPLIESQISNPTSTATLRTSGKIPIPSGSKSYIVQAKTDMTDFAAHIDNARLKIILK